MFDQLRGSLYTVRNLCWAVGRNIQQLVTRAIKRYPDQLCERHPRRLGVIKSPLGYALVGSVSRFAHQVLLHGSQSDVFLKAEIICAED